ncbi:PTS sugar transporter subunit IIB [Caviibacter abscessus]|uniref:PTS sugar transporter subunit IIB n=1 Tax=Caviibacter abscessus TaxID=1766719 RepID=UPI000835FC4A|nr:PTS sugar transporter subunit IIB [Caviibacter abscessus]
MLNILLVCTAGMSTSVLVEKMKSKAEQIGKKVNIKAIGDTALSEHVNDYDVVLLGPQIKFLYSKIRNEVPAEKPVEVINMMDYGTMNAEKILERAFEITK